MDGQTAVQNPGKRTPASGGGVAARCSACAARWLDAGILPEELSWAARVAALIVLLTLVPYLIAWGVRGDDFLGHVFVHSDANAHLAWMRQAAEGRWIFSNRFTTEAHKPHFFHLYFLVLGRIAGLFGGSYLALQIVAHVSRVLFAWLLLVGVYLLASCVYPDRSVRRAALWIVGLSSGLGWYLSLAGLGKEQIPDYGPELLMPEAITFLGITIYPLFAAALFFLLSTYVLLLRALETGQWRWAVAAGIAGLILTNIHTYDLPPICLALALYVALQAIRQRQLPRRELRAALIFLMCALPALAYQYHLFAANPIFRPKALQPTPSPPPGAYVCALGLLFFAALGGAARLLREPSRRGELLVVWAAATLAMAYCPVSFQRKMVEGIHLPLAMLAASGWVALGRRHGVSQPRWLVLFIALTVPSNIAVFAYSLRETLGPPPGTDSYMAGVYWLGPGPRAALNWLARNARRDDIVLSHRRIGNYLPAWCGVRSYAGHGAETLDSDQKVEKVRHFLAPGTSEAWREEFLREQGIRYFLYSAQERAYGSYSPDRCRALVPVFKADGVTLYEVRLPG